MCMLKLHGLLTCGHVCTYSPIRKYAVNICIYIHTYIYIYIYIYIGYNMDTRDLPDVYAQARLRYVYQANPRCPCYN